MYAFLQIGLIPQGTSNDTNSYAKLFIVTFNCDDSSDSMITKVKDLTVDELRSLVSDTVRGVMEDTIEDMVALTSERYLQSIEEARRDYKEARVKSFEDVFDV